MMTSMASSWAATAPALEEEEEEEGEIEVSHINARIEEKREESDIVDIKINQTNVELKEKKESMNHNNVKTKEQQEKEIKPNISHILTNVEINNEETKNVIDVDINYTNAKDNDIVRRQRIGGAEKEGSIWRDGRSKNEDWRSGGFLGRGNDDVFVEKRKQQDVYLEERMKTSQGETKERRTEGRGEGGEMHEKRSWEAKGRQEGGWRSHAGQREENGFLTESGSTESRSRETNGQIGDAKKNAIWSESKIFQGGISIGGNMDNFGGNRTKEIEKDEKGKKSRLGQTDKQTNTENAALCENPKDEQRGVRWFDKVEESSEKKSEDSSRWEKVGQDLGEILQKWEELTGHERFEKHLRKEENVRTDRQEEEERVKDNTMWKSEMEKERENTLHSWELIGSLKDSLEKKGTKKDGVVGDGVDSGNFQDKGQVRAQGVKRGYLLI